METVGPEVAAAARRFWEARQKGQPVAIDDVLATAPGTAEYLATRATAIQLIAAQATALGDRADASAQERETLASSLGLSSVGTISDQGPLPTIEGYDLVACLGRGGMGAVFEGYQRSTGRRVAIKFMLDRLGASEAARKRFEREVEVVARLQHPGIVSVLDSGVRRGQYFFVMEFVAGKGLDAAIVPGQGEVRRILQLMAKVCDAVDYAHQRGVLHRDLKPSNIFVDDADAPRLLDFGLAKVFDPSQSDGGSHGAMGLTVSGPGQLLGTLAYMAPEQARGSHDLTSVRTDVYSLCAITYELLCGRLPCPMSSSVSESLARIINQPPVAPSTVRRGLSRDLDAVLLRGLEKVPERRYATAGELAADLRRHLAGEPVVARRVSPAGRAVRWIGRNRTISGVIGAAIITLAIVSGYLITRILSERDVARSNFEIVKGILETADPDRFNGVVQLLDGATDRLDKSPPKEELAEAEIRQLVGTVYTRFGEYTKARKAALRALDIRERHSSGDDAGVADALHNVAASYWWEGNYDQAEPLYSRSLAMRERLFRGDHPSVAFSLSHLAACRLRMGRLDDARELYERALLMRTRLYGNEHEEVAQSLNNVAKCDLEAERFERAQTLFTRSLDMIRRLKGETHTGTASASHNRGDCLLRRAIAAANMGDSESSARYALEAQSDFGRAVEIRETLFKRDHNLVATSLASLSRAEGLLQRHDIALEHARRAVDMLTRLKRTSHPDMADALEALGLAQVAVGESTAGAATLRHALDIVIQAKPPADVAVARIQENLARTLLAQRNPSQAEPLLTESLKTLRRLRGDYAPSTRAAARLLIEAYRAQGNTAAAESLRAIAGSQ